MLKDSELIAEVHRHLHLRPTRKEWLVAAINEIALEINDLLRIKAEYEQELKEAIGAKD